jgi:hypothetical protein
MMGTPADQFGAKPAVLRCSRCGKLVDWADAQLQVVCTCRIVTSIPLGRSALILLKIVAIRTAVGGSCSNGARR